MILRNVNIALPSGVDANAPVFAINNVITDALLTVTADASYPKSNLANPATFLKWKNSAATAVTITIETLSTDTDYIGIARHNFGTVGASIKVQGDTGSGYVDIVSVYTPTTDDPILLNFTKASYIGLKVVIGAGSAAQEAAVLYAGAAMYGQRNIYVGHRPITLVPQLDVVNGRSEAGEFLGRIIIGERRSTSIELTELTPGWVRSALDPFFIAAKSTPFFFAWRPDTYPLEVGYVWMAGDPEVSNTRGNGYMASSFSVSGVA